MNKQQRKKSEEGVMSEIEKKMEVASNIGQEVCKPVVVGRFVDDIDNHSHLIGDRQFELVGEANLLQRF
jgi:hypothetical protein